MEPSTQPVPTALGITLVVLLVAANAFFVAAEFALVGARTTRLDEMARAGDRRARLARKALRKLDRYISATQLGITLASLGLGWAGEPALAHVVDGLFHWLPEGLGAVATHTVASAIAFAIITVLHIVLGELVPKTLALLYPEKISAAVVAPLLGFSWLMAGPIALLNGIANGLVSLLGLRPPGQHGRLHSPEEIRMLVEQSGEGGALGAGDARMLEGVFEFSEKSAGDVMTPRTEMIVLPASLSVQDAADRVAAARRSRYPVVVDSIDSIVGVVHAKDVLAALRASPEVELLALMRKPLFVPRTKEVEDVLVDMKRLKVHLAVVLDEYGGTAGLVTMEDLLEEIVGPIFDEHDRAERQYAAAVETPQGTLLPGSTPVVEFNKRYGVALDADEYATLGGFLFGELGRLPVVGETVEAGGRVFEIVQMSANRVVQVRMRPAATTDEGP
jgi:CBS domain containing-hemolysin-like protein